MILEQAGGDYRRILTDKGAIVGFASKLMNGKWCACDFDGVRIKRAGIFAQARHVKKWFENDERS